MVTISKKMNMMLLAAMVACAPVCASENQAMEMVSEQQDTANAQDSVVWYKKRSTHIMAALAATAVGIYALAVRKNKIAGPIALFTALFCVNKKAQEVKNPDEVKDTQHKQQDAGITPQDNATQQIDQNNASTIENSKTTEPVTLEDQKSVMQEKTPGETNPAENTEKNEQPLLQVDKNTQVASEAPLHIKALKNAEGLWSSLKQGFKDGRHFRTSAK